MNTARKPIRVLFVCMGNICRSPASEIIFRKLVADAGHADTIEADSAGTIGNHQGEPPDARMAATLRASGYPVTGCARQIQAADLADFDLIVTMDDDNMAALRALDSDGQYRTKIRPLVNFCRIHYAAYVPDPYYGDQQRFEQIIGLIEDGCAGILAELTTPRKPVPEPAPPPARRKSQKPRLNVNQRK